MAIFWKCTCMNQKEQSGVVLFYSLEPVKMASTAGETNTEAGERSLSERFRHHIHHMLGADPVLVVFDADRIVDMFEGRLGRDVGRFRHHIHHMLGAVPVLAVFDADRAVDMFEGRLGRDVGRAGGDTEINASQQANAPDANGPVGSDVTRSLPWFVRIHSTLAPFELGILQVYSQGSSPFKTHQPIMWIFMLGDAITMGASLSHDKCSFIGSRCLKIVELVGCISRSLTSAAFLSILAPPSLMAPIFIVWMLQLPLYIDSVRDRVLNVAMKLYNYLSNGAGYVQNLWNIFIGSNTEEQAVPQTS